MDKEYLKKTAKYVIAAAVNAAVPAVILALQGVDWSKFGTVGTIIGMILTGSVGAALLHKQSPAGK